MEPRLGIQIIKLASLGLELAGVAVIGISFLYATFRAFGEFRRKKTDAFERLKLFIGRALQLGLEFLVAADIIRTVTVEPTRQNIVTLALLIAVRTFLSWSITVEVEGCWPWGIAANKGR